ncbi:Uncharacterised protein [[Clostridium] symbiosum]|nr:Uncharacterised protein [[Clostridium] symbiosum]
MGQARKSLWIETFLSYFSTSLLIGVRLVRACGSKPVSSFQSVRHHWVRLVRACGSKLYVIFKYISSPPGQARKSLWIET